MNLTEITSLISAIMTTIIGIINVKLISHQMGLQKLQNKMHEREHQPLFTIDYLRGKTPDSSIYNYEECCVKNIGHIANSINISTKFYIQIKYVETTSSKSITTYAKLSHYYGILSHTGNAIGEIIKSYFSDELKNYECFHKIYNDAINFHKRFKNAIILVDLIKIFIIEYVDIYGIKHTIYMDSNNIINKEYYKSVDDCSMNDYNQTIFNIQSISLEKLIKENNTLKEIVNI